MKPAKVILKYSLKSSDLFIYLFQKKRRSLKPGCLTESGGPKNSQFKKCLAWWMYRESKYEGCEGGLPPPQNEECREFHKKFENSKEEMSIIYANGTNVGLKRRRGFLIFLKSFLWGKIIIIYTSSSFFF